MSCVFFRIINWFLVWCIECCCVCHQGQICKNADSCVNLYPCVIKYYLCLCFCLCLYLCLYLYVTIREIMLINIISSASYTLQWRRGVEGGMEVGEEGGYIPIATLSPPQWLLHFNMGSDECRFTVSLIMRDEVSRQCPQTTTFWRERRADAESNRSPFAYQHNALPLGQIGGSRGLLLTLKRNCSLEHEL